jgi:hypothetical protein
VALGAGPSRAEAHAVDSRRRIDIREKMPRLFMIIRSAEGSLISALGLLE